MTIIVQSTASASARDYAWLQASIARWLHRTDLDTVIPDFVMLAEKRINGDIEARLAEGTTTLTVKAGESQVALPADFAELRSLSIVGSALGPLTYVSASRFNEPNIAAGREPRIYTITGNTIRIAPTPQRGQSLSLVYRGGVPALVDMGGTNWLIETNPDVYLAATMCEALMYTRDTVELQKWEGKYANAIALLSSYTEWEDAGSLTLRAPAT